MERFNIDYVNEHWLEFVVVGSIILLLVFIIQWPRKPWH